MRLRLDYLITILVLLALVWDAEAATGNRRRARRSVTAKRVNANKVNARKANAAANTKKAAVASPAKIQSRIVGGQTTTISNYPFLVQVRRGSALCGGTLVATNWVLTAAHCAKGYSASDFRVRGGTTTLDGSDGVTQTVSKIFIAPKFTSGAMNMDAALLKLSAPLTGTNIATIPMASSGPKAGSTVRVAGWGYTSEGGSVSNTLKAAQIRVTNRKRCSRDYKGLSQITKYMFCARGRKTDSCSGDSGGSVVQNGAVVGIVSFGYGCARSGYPGVYTKVAMIRKWTTRIMANN